jgi:hypothetical protein
MLIFNSHLTMNLQAVQDNTNTHPFLPHEQSLNMSAHHVKRNVRFQNEPSINIIPSLSLTREWRRQLWYSRKDYDHFNQRDKKIAQHVRLANKEGAPISACVRGIEHMLSKRANIDFKHRIVMTVQCVLDEQRRQKSLRIVNAVKIRKVSMAASREARILALILGKGDREAVYRKAAMKVFENNSNSAMDKSPIAPRRLSLHLRDNNIQNLISIEGGDKTIFATVPATSTNLPIAQATILHAF